MRLRDLKQESYSDICQLNEKQAKHKLMALGLLPDPHKKRTCFRCHAVMKFKASEGLVCSARSCRTRIRSVALAYTPLWHMQKSGHFSFHTYLRALYVFSCRIPQDAAVHMRGLGPDSVDTWYGYFRIALAFSELYQGRELEFPEGAVEADSTKTFISRSSAKGNTHSGRFLVIYHRESRKYCLEALPSKFVLKGAPPPPETYDEVRVPLMKKLKKGHIFSSDSAQAFQKVGKRDLAKKSIPHAMVVHKNKQWTSVVHIPMKNLPVELRKHAATLPTSNSRTLRFRAGDQACEGIFAAVKRNMKRLNLHSNAAKVNINFLSTACLQKNIGLCGVASQMKYYLESIADAVHPKDAYVSTSWLTTLECIDEEQ